MPKRATSSDEQAGLLRRPGSAAAEEYYGAARSSAAAAAGAPPAPGQEQMATAGTVVLQGPSYVPLVFQTGVKYEFRFQSMREFFVVRQGTNEAVTKIRHDLWKKKGVDRANAIRDKNLFDTSASTTTLYGINLLNPATNELQMSVSRPDFRRGNYDAYDHLEKNAMEHVLAESDMCFFGSDVSKPPVALVSAHAVGCCPGCGCGEPYVEFARMPGTKVASYNSAATIFCTHSVVRTWSEVTMNYKIGQKQFDTPPFCRVTRGGSSTSPVVLELVAENCGPQVAEWQRQLAMLVAIRFSCVAKQEEIDNLPFF